MAQVAQGAEDASVVHSMFTVRTSNYRSFIKIFEFEYGRRNIMKSSRDNSKMILITGKMNVEKVIVSKDESLNYMNIEFIIFKFLIFFKLILRGKFSFIILLLLFKTLSKFFTI